MANDDINYDPILFALSEECPLHLGNPANCQLYKVRQKSLLERLSYIATLSEETKVAMIKCHEKCLLEKQGNVLTTKTRL